MRRKRLPTEASGRYEHVSRDQLSIPVHEAFASPPAPLTLESASPWRCRFFGEQSAASRSRSASRESRRLRRWNARSRACCRGIPRKEDHRARLSPRQISFSSCQAASPCGSSPTVADNCFRVARPLPPVTLLPASGSTKQWSVTSLTAKGRYALRGWCWDPCFGTLASVCARAEIASGGLKITDTTGNRSHGLGLETRERAGGEPCIARCRGGMGSAATC